MRRRRKTKFNWFPVYGTPQSVDGGFFSTFSEMVVSITPGGDPFNVGVQAVVANDTPNQQGEELEVLNDIIGNEYITKRLVGKCFADVEYAPNAAIDIGVNLPHVIATAGLFVARKLEDESATGANVLPVDFSARGNFLYNPLNAALTREPWIWRRSWKLGPGNLDTTQFVSSSGDIQQYPQVLAAVDPFHGAFPWNNSHYGSIQDGPHIDAKSSRRVRQDEALFFAGAIQLSPIGANFSTDLTNVSVRFSWELRVLGALRRAKNRSNF